jgi:hypothetical protein
MDGLLNPRLTSQKSPSVYWWVSLILLVLMVLTIPFIREFTPAKSIKDSAAVLTVVFAVMCLSTLLRALQKHIVMMLSKPKNRLQLQDATHLEGQASK